MRIEQQYYNILWHKQPKDILLAIEQAGRTCYKSEDGISKKEKQIEDLKKAIWYIKREIKHLSNEEE